MLLEWREWLTEKSLGTRLMTCVFSHVDPESLHLLRKHCYHQSKVTSEDFSAAVQVSPAKCVCERDDVHINHEDEAPMHPVRPWDPFIEMRSLQSLGFRHNEGNPKCTETSHALKLLGMVEKRILAITL